MTPAEVAIVQALERSLGSSDETEGPFHPWWLDDTTTLGETHEDWPDVWAGVLAHAQHPAVVAHLSDLLWVARHGSTPHLHARRAVDAYLASSPPVQEAHDESRALMRAFDLATAINDAARVGASERRVCEAANAALTHDDLGIAVALLEHVSGRRLTGEGSEAVGRLLERTWDVAARPDVVERVARLLLKRITDSAERAEICTRVVDTYRSAAQASEGFGQLVAMREALRVAEELGHPAHDEILHEIETLDSDSVFTSVPFERVLSRAMVSDFCAAVVGSDSLENALGRFAVQLTITPAALQQIRDNTEVGIRHLVTNVLIGEANSVVTSSETAASDEDHLAVALERDALRTLTIQAGMVSFLFLTPALHQLLEAYEPWTVSDIRSLLERGLADVVIADALARSLDHFRNRRYDEAAHVALPRIERFIRLIARDGGIATTKRPTKRVGGIRGLGEILLDLRGDGTRPILPEPLLTAAELTLVDPDALNLRNDLLHGIRDEVRAGDAAMILQLGLALALMLSAEVPPTSAR